VKALVIDDSKAMRMIIGKTLRQAGLEVHEAGNGREALERLEEIGSADVILVDWNMPEMNGLDFVKAVRAHESHKAIPLIMVTTETEIEQMTKALEAGANEYLMKPFHKEALVEKLTMLGLELP